MNYIVACQHRFCLNWDAVCRRLWARSLFLPLCGHLFQPFWLPKELLPFLLPFSCKLKKPLLAWPSAAAAEAVVQKLSPGSPTTGAIFN